MVKIEGVRFKVRRRQLSISSIINEERDTARTRGEITGWNEGMARRLRAYLDNFRQDFVVMVTLTYGANAPKDGREVKRHLNALRERMRRMGWFEHDSLVWFLEFQKRGAPHLHMFSTGWVSKGWISTAWAEITNGNPDACSRVEALRSPKGAGGYAIKYAAKAEQKTVPADFLNVGRFWGVWGAKISRGLPRVPVVVASTPTGTPAAHWVKIWRAARALGLRMVDTPVGWTLYGEPREIMAAWHYLQGVIAHTDRLEVSRDDFARAMQGESCGT